VEEIKKELDEHLSTINENTNEMQANYEFLMELDSKIAKLNERLDQMQMLLDPTCKKDEAVCSSPLTKREQEVFLIIYTAKGSLLTYADIARRTGLPETLVESYVTSLMVKGIPITKTYRSTRTYLRLEEKYRLNQAKNDILKLNEAIVDRLF
jgi:hypothetical protein